MLLLLVVLAATLYTLKFAPWVPARKYDLRRILKIADVKPGEKFYDLGCGDGRLVRAAAGHGAEAVGIELSPPLYLWCKMHGLLRPVQGASYLLRNFFDVDLTDADIVYLFGTGNTLGEKITRKLEKELRPGTRIISYVFPIEGWTSEKTDKPENRLPVYLYRR